LLAFTLAGVTPQEQPLHVIFNMWWEARTVAVPAIPGCAWRRVIDTALASPDDITTPDQPQTRTTEQYLVQPRSVVVLEGC
jgi:isoamylase